MALGSRIRATLRRVRPQEITEAAGPGALPATPERRGYEIGIPPGGLDEYRQAMGVATQTDRRSLMQELYEAYLSCPWANASVNAIARTITAGGLVTDWDSDAGEGDQQTPDKPENVLALERLFAYCNPQDDIRQLLRVAIIDLLVFGDAFLEVVWVGSVPVSIYNIDAPTMYPKVNEHGTVTGYAQVTEYGQRADFEPQEIIHISLDAPRAGAFGVSPTQAALLPITAWLFAASCGKEMFRKGLPPMLHVDFPAGTSEPEMNRWRGRHMQQVVGPRNIGTPVATRGGAHVAELAMGRPTDVLTFLDQKRDEIVSVYGVPPAKAGIIESGNLGGGTGEQQDKTFRVNTCQPIAELLLEKLNFAIVRQGFGIVDWHAKFGEVDYRDSAVIEQIRDTRLRNGSWTLNRYRTEIGEPPVPGGDNAVLIDRQNLVVWADITRMSAANVAAKGAPAVAAGEAPPGGEPMLGPGAGAQPGEEDDGQVGGPATSESTPWSAHSSAYRRRLREALAALPGRDLDEAA